MLAGRARDYRTGSTGAYGVVLDICIGARHHARGPGEAKYQPRAFALLAGRIISELRSNFGGLVAGWNTLFYQGNEPQGMA